MVAGNSSVADDVELVEFHDAVIERVEMTRHGDVCIEFSHLPVYRRETPNSCGVWSFHAELRLVGIESFTAEGRTPNDEAESLYAAKLIGKDGSAVEMNALLRVENIALGSLELAWALGGAQVVFRGGTMNLKLLEPLERVETWIDEEHTG